MCGITGFVDFSNTSKIDQLESMVQTLNHRGPDDFGAEILDFKETAIGFGQTRLSIIDLSSGGHQPFHYKHFSMVFNGEIYNYKEIKEELNNLGHQFVSTSDTEVILHAVSEWGLEAVHKFIGMFVYVIFDRNKNRISLSRDRAGIKPLYYFQNDEVFLFGSELKSIMAHPKFEKQIDEKVLPFYFQHGYIAAPFSIFKKCYKLEPGHHLILDLQNKKTKKIKYWDVFDFYKKPKLKITYDEAKEKLHTILISACNYRMVADVPVGVFLSGGYDSTAVTAILQADKNSKLKTFTIGFEEGNNEAPFAKKTSEYFGTDHTEYICTTKEAQELISDLPYFFDEPFGDSSAIPTTLVSKLAKGKVTVALSADAGDEIFCGYNSYFELYGNLKKIEKIPNALKPIAGFVGKNVLGNVSSSDSAKLYKISAALQSLNRNDNIQAKNIFQKSNEKPTAYLKKFFEKNIVPYQSSFDIDSVGFQHPIEVAMAIDYKSYLQNDILTKVDRCTMSVSLEGREPFLDHRIVEFVAQLPFDFKYKDGVGKRILKDIVHDYIPKEMMDRPKTGFSLPISKWLRGDLKYLIDTHMNPESLAASGLFNVPFVTEQIDKFNNNKLHYTPIIWYTLMFQMWYKKWM